MLIAHVAAHTETIRLGAGGIMLPNHSPLVIAEQFGTLAELHPGRIDLGLGRAPGSDQATARALRRDPAAAERFPQDVVELQGLLSDQSPIPGVRAIPGQGTHVPLYILGSSLFGAQLAAMLGLPYALRLALRPGRRCTRRSALPGPSSNRPRSSTEPYVIAGVNVIAADTERGRARQSRGDPPVPGAQPLRPRRPAGSRDDEVDAILRSPQGADVDADAHLHRGRHPGHRRRLPRRLPASTPAPTS